MNNNMKKITLSGLVACLVVGFSAFTSAEKNTIKVTKDADGKIISVTSYFYNLDGNPANTAASNFIYRDATTPADCALAGLSNECAAEWTTTNMPVNNQSPTDAGSPIYVGNGITEALYNGR